MNNVLVLENLSDVEEMCAEYIREYNLVNKCDYLMNLHDRQPNEILNALLNPQYDSILLQSLFQNEVQLMSIIKLLHGIIGKTKIKTISIIYTSNNPFELFLYDFTQRYKEIIPYLIDVFEHYKIVSVETVQLVTTREYFNSINTLFDRIPMYYTKHEVEGDLFMNIRATVIDPRSAFRKYDLTDLVAKGEAVVETKKLANTAKEKFDKGDLQSMLEEIIALFEWRDEEQSIYCNLEENKRFIDLAKNLKKHFKV